MKKPSFTIKCIQFQHDENFKMIGDPIYSEFAGSTLKEAKAAWNAARDNNDVVKFSPLTIYDIINSEEDTPDPADDNAMYYMDTEELTSIYADITEEQTTETTETTDTEEEEEEGTMRNNFTPAEAAMHAATVRGIIRRQGGYRERDIITHPHTVERGETWNDAHKVVNVLEVEPQADGYRAGFAVDLVTRSIVG